MAVVESVSTIGFRRLERRELRDQFSGAVESNGAAVKDQLIVSADDIAIHDRALMRAGHRRDHLTARRRVFPR